MNWSWDHLRFFLSLAEHGTLSAAAKKLNVSHTTVHRRIKAFECELRTQLFAQHSHGYKLTAEGEALLTEAQKMESAITGIAKEISGADELINGPVTITSTDTLSQYVLPAILTEISELYPAVELSLIMMNQFSDIYNHEADIAIRTGVEPPENLIGRKIGNLEFSIATSVKYKQERNLSNFPCDTHGLNFIVLDDTYRNVVACQWLRKLMPKKSRCTTVSNFSTAAALCGAGMGIALLPSYLVALDIRLTALRLTKEIPANDLWILSHKDHRDTKRVRLVRQHLFSALSERLT
ncbi:MAG: LysR family transcriptional regulator [Granulosicoccus sp.]